MRYRTRLDKEEAEKKKRDAEDKLKAEEVERKKREQEKLKEGTRSLKEKGESLDRKEQEVIEEMQTANELLLEGTVKLQTVLSSGSKADSQSAKIACLMIETAKSNQAQAKRKLAAVREKQKVINTHKQKLLDKALTTGVSAPPSKKRKAN